MEDPEVMTKATMEVIAAVVTHADTGPETISRYLAFDKSDEGTHFALYVLGVAVGVMWRQLDDVTERQFFGIEMGEQTRDHPDPARLFAVRWMASAMNRDLETCSALYQSVPVNAETVDALIEVLFGTMRQVGRALVAKNGA